MTPQLPHCAVTERYAVSSILENPRLLGDVQLQGLEPDHFLNAEARDVFAEIRVLESRGEAISAASVTARLKQRRALQRDAAPDSWLVGDVDAVVSTIAELAVRTPPARIAVYRNVAKVQRDAEERRAIRERIDDAERAQHEHEAARLDATASLAITYASKSPASLHAGDFESKSESFADASDLTPPDDDVPHAAECPANPDAGQVSTRVAAGIDKRPPRWRRCRDLVGAIMKQSADPSIALKLGADTIAEVRPGAIVLLIGASGGGKTSFAASLAVEHAAHVGPAIVASLELPGEEFTGRVVGMGCDAGWLDVMTGKVPEQWMRDALPERLIVIERRDASIEALADAIADMKREYPGEPILCVCDYVQILPSDEREVRRRVADAMARLDGVARDHRVALLALSQGSRASSRGLKSGELKGADTTDAGAEAAELERWSTLTLAIGTHAPSEDGDTAIAELNVGKSRMGSGDRVIPMRYCGRSGRWRVAGESRPAAEVRAEADASQANARRSAAELAMIAAADRAPEALTREELRKAAAASRDIARAAVEALLGRGDLVEVKQRQPRSPAWRIWTRARAEAAGVSIVEVDHGS